MPDQILAKRSRAEGATSSMKITFILSCYPWRPVGALRVVYEYANHLVIRGHQVTVVHPRSVRDNFGFWTPHTFSGHLRRGAKHLRDVLFVPNVRWQTIDARVRMSYVAELTIGSIPDADVIIADAWDTIQYICQFPPNKGSKFHLVQSYSFWSRFDAQTASEWHTSFNKIAVSRWLRNKLTEIGCREVSYIPIAVNQSVFQLFKPIAGRTKRVAMLYSLTECKGSQEGICALEIAKREHPNLRAVMFGIPKRPPYLPGWIEYFRNPAPHDLVHGVYNGSSIFLCSSREESFALPPVEAMACGCALVTTDCGGNREYTEEGINALVSPPQEPQSLARNLTRVLSDESLRLSLARNGYERVQRLSWEHSTDLLEEFIKCQLNKGNYAIDSNVT